MSVALFFGFVCYCSTDRGTASRNMDQCQAAVAEAIEEFGKLDILLCCCSKGWLHVPLSARFDAAVSLLSG